jgi:hypothetical protein
LTEQGFSPLLDEVDEGVGLLKRLRALHVVPESLEGLWVLNERIRVLDFHEVRVEKRLPIFGLNKKVPGGVQLVP